MVKPTVVKVVRVTTRAGAVTVVWCTDRLSAPQTTRIATGAMLWDISPSEKKTLHYAEHDLYNDDMSCRVGN